MVVNDRTKAALLENEQWVITSLQLRIAPPPKEKKLALVRAAPHVLCFIIVRFTGSMKVLIDNCKEMRSSL